MGKVRDVQSVRYSYLQYFAVSADTSVLFKISLFKNMCSSAPRFHGMHADLNPVSFTCSQLQNYDPERALTDYINRLEALQRRLGSVQSGKGSGSPPRGSWVAQGTVPS